MNILIIIDLLITSQDECDIYHAWKLQLNYYRL
jgi:hypothetical protein